MLPRASSNEAETMRYSPTSTLHQYPYNLRTIARQAPPSIIHHAYPALDYNAGSGALVRRVCFVRREQLCFFVTIHDDGYHYNALPHPSQPSFPQQSRNVRQFEKTRTWRASESRPPLLQRLTPIEIVRHQDRLALHRPLYVLPRRHAGTEFLQRTPMQVRRHLRPRQTGTFMEASAALLDESTECHRHPRAARDLLRRHAAYQEHTSDLRLRDHRRQATLLPAGAAHRIAPRRRAHRCLICRIGCRRLMMRSTTLGKTVTICPTSRIGCHPPTIRTTIPNLIVIICPTSPTGCRRLTMKIFTLGLKALTAPSIA